MERDIRYCTTADGARIAYCAEGEGPAVIRVPPVPWSHVQREADIFPTLLLTRGLREQCRTVWFDSRGSGLSDRENSAFSLQTLQMDLEAVVDQLQLESYALCAVWDGVPAAVTHAAGHPESVTHLVLVEGYTNGSDYLASPAGELEAGIRDKDWVLYTEMLARLIWGYDDPDFGARTAEHMRACTDPATLRQAYDAINESWDIADVAPNVAAPTLVVNNENLSWLPLRAGQRLAARIPDARFLTVDDLRYERVPAIIARFILGEAAGPDEQGKLPAVLRTVLFTDLVGHTEMMSRLGDAKGRDVLREHERITREVLKAHGGTEVKTMGDGFMASFSSVTKAVECAIALQRAFADRNRDVGAQRPFSQRSIAASDDGSQSGSDFANANAAPSSRLVEPLHVRVGLNAGEPIEEDGDLFGATVILASRIAAKADGGEILVADTVRGLCSGKGFLFADRGEFVAKGIEEPVRISEVSWRE